MSLAARTSWVIERNLGDDLTLAILAEACGVSRFHLAHAFGEATGRSVMAHVRGRRLSEAARALAAGAPSILDLALDWGYGSHEAFSRAFRDQFGIAPEQVRKASSLDGLCLTGPVNGDLERPRYTARAKGGPMRMQRETIDETWIFVGLPGLYDFKDLEKIAGQWARFMPRYAEIEDKADPVPWGIGRAIDADGRLDYATAVRVTGTRAAVPDGFVRFVVSPRTYAVFRHAAHVSRIRATYDAIWNDWLPASGFKVAQAPTLEHHCDTFDRRTGDGGVDIWIPLEG
jgi:AraC family transcriptional regulator